MPAESSWSCRHHQGCRTHPLSPNIRDFQSFSSNTTSQKVNQLEQLHVRIVSPVTVLLSEEVEKFTHTRPRPPCGRTPPAPRNQDHETPGASGHQRSVPRKRRGRRPPVLQVYVPGKRREAPSRITQLLEGNFSGQTKLATEMGPVCALCSVTRRRAHFTCTHVHLQDGRTDGVLFSSAATANSDGGTPRYLWLRTRGVRLH